MIKVECSKCGYEFSVTDWELTNIYLGRKVKCPNCGKMIGVKND